MRTIWHSLAWKEWHEHKWKFAALAAILSGASISAMVANTEQADGPILGLLLLPYYILPLAVFLGAGDAGGEPERGTLNFLTSLPAPPRKAAISKLMCGIATCVVSIVAALIVLRAGYWLVSERTEKMLLVLSRRNAGFPVVIQLDDILMTWVVSVGIYASVAGVSVYLWTAACGVGCKRDVHAGVWALSVIVVWWTIVGFVANATGSNWENWENPFSRLVASSVMGISPGGLAMALAVTSEPRGSPPISASAAIVASVLFHSALAAWFVFRFGRLRTTDRFTAEAAGAERQAAQTLKVPRRHPLTAVMWKQFRESLPIVAAGLAAIACFLGANLVAHPEFYTGQPHRVLGLFMGLTGPVGVVVALVVGVGVFDRDLGPTLNQFWRSRPIHPDLWFWTKFITGLCVLLAALYGPLLFMHLWLQLSPGLYHPDMIWVISLSSAIYAAAVVMICLIRQPVYAAILGLGMLVLCLGAAAYFVGLQVEDDTRTFVPITITMAVVATLIGWLAVRYDWGYKSRY